MKNKILSIVLLLVCIIISVVVDILMKKKEGFHEGLDDNPSNEKELKEKINTIINDTTETKTEKQYLKILEVIGVYLKKHKPNQTVTQTMNVLAMNTSYDKKINIIGLLLTSDNL